MGDALDLTVCACNPKSTQRSKRMQKAVTVRDIPVKLIWLIGSLLKFK